MAAGLEGLVDSIYYLSQWHQQKQIKPGDQEINAAEHRQNQSRTYVRISSAPATFFRDAAADEHFCPKFELSFEAKETCSNLGPSLRRFCSNKIFGEVVSPVEPNPPKCPHL